MTNSERKIVCSGVHADLWHKLRVVAASKDLPLWRALEEAIKAYVQEDTGLRRRDAKDNLIS